MDDTIITNPGDIVLVKIGKEKQIGFYAKVINAIASKNLWVVNFCPLIPTPDFKLIVVSWLLDNNQIRGQEFTVDGIPHQLFKVEFLENKVIRAEKIFEKIFKKMSQEDKLRQVDKDTKHPPKLKDNKKPFLTLVKK